MRLGLCKRLMVCLFAVISMQASANTDITTGTTGNYLGIQLGTSNMDAQTLSLPNYNGDYVLTRPSKKGFGTRVFWGYQFINYLGLEGGFAYFTPATYNIQDGNSPEWRVEVVDILGKGVLPLYWGINFFVKAGAAIAAYKQGGLLAPNPTSSHDGANGITVRPEFGVGIDYAFTPNWHVDLSATQITKGSQVPKISYYAIGLSYHAVDIYCGQFLC